MSLPERFARAEQRYHELGALLRAGKLPPADFEAAYRRELVLEHEGRYWTLGRESGRWFVHDGTRWREEAPPQEAPGALRELARFPVHAAAVAGVALSADGTRAISASFGDGTIRVWDTASGATLRTIEVKMAEVVAFSPSGRYGLHATTYPATVEVWETESGRAVSRFTGHPATVRSACFSPDGRSVFSAGDDGTIRQWDTLTAAPIRVFEGQKGPVVGVALSPDGVRLASLGGEELRLWTVATGALERVVPLGRDFDDVFAKQVLFTPDGGRVVTVSMMAQALAMYDVATGARVRSLGRDGGNVFAAAVSPDGRTLYTANGTDDWGADAVRAVGEDDAIHLFDVATGEERAQVPAHHRSVTSLCVSLDGRRLLTGSADGAVGLWSTGGT